MDMTYIRKPNRYKNYDYSSAGGYFITICSKNNEHIFSKITTHPVAAISDCHKPVAAISDCHKPVAAISDCHKPVAAFSDCHNENRNENQSDDISQSEIGTTIVNDRFVYPNLELTEIGKIVEDTIIEISNFREKFNISSYVIMPNHIHLIILIYDLWKPDGSVKDTLIEVSNIIRYLKSSVTKKIGISKWHPRFYDHILRDEIDFYNHSVYIQSNPLNWINDEYYS